MRNVLAQNLGSSDDLSKDIENNLVIHRRTSCDVCTFAHWSMLWRHRRCCDQPPVLRMRLHIVEQEVGSPLHHGVVLFQQLFVAGKQILLPDVCGQPGATRREHTPRSAIHRSGDTPDVGIMVSHPATTAIHHISRLGSRHAEIFDHRQQRLLRLHQIAHHRGPVVHLGIDIDGILRIPGRILLVVPHAL